MVRLRESGLIRVGDSGNILPVSGPQGPRRAPCHSLARLAGGIRSQIRCSAALIKVGFLRTASEIGALESDGEMKCRYGD